MTTTFPASVLSYTDKNSAFGFTAGTGITTGTANTGVGYGAMISLTTGSSNTCVGRSADVSGSTSNTTVLGANISSSTSNEVVLANSSQTVVRPDGNNTTDLGALSKQFKNLYLGSGAYLPTSGGTAAQLNYYENFTGSVVWGGPLVTNVGGTLSWEKIGNTVNLTVTGITGTSGASSSGPLSIGANAIPARLQPSSNTYFVSRVIDNNNGVTGVMLVQTDGNITFYPNLALGNFTASSTIGFSMTGASYNLV